MVFHFDARPGIQMSTEEFKQWLIRVDSNQDGQISKQELREALRALGLSFTGWKAWRGVANADLNNNNQIDGDLEMKELINYARKRWGVIIN